MKLHTGDTVVVITGKDKGKTGTILRVLETERRIVISGVNMRTKHIKKTYQEAGRIIHYEASIDASNVMLIDPKTKKRSRVGYKVDEKGKKTRISKVSGEVVARVKAKKTVTEGKKGKEGKAESVAPAAEKKPTKQPFWRKKGGAAEQEGEVKEGAHMKQDHTIPDQQIHVRSGGRGS